MNEKEKEKKVEFKKTSNKKESADYLRKLADSLEKGEVTIHDLKIEIPEDFVFEIEYKEKEGKKELEIEIEWK